MKNDHHLRDECSMHYASSSLLKAIAWLRDETVVARSTLSRTGTQTSKGNGLNTNNNIKEKRGVDAHKRNYGDDSKRDGCD